MRRTFGLALILSSLTFLIGDSYAQNTAKKDASNWNEAVDGPLPHYRLNSTLKDDPNQRLTPYAIDLKSTFGPPTSGTIDPSTEYDPMDGVLFRYSSTAWAAFTTDCVTKLTADPTTNDIAYVIVANTSMQNHATNNFTAAGADMSKVVFIQAPTDSIWIRDYGPHFIWQNNTLALTDSHYYPNRVKDNFIPTIVAEDVFQIHSYHMGLYYSGGNFLPGSNRSGFVTSLISLDNPGFSNGYIANLYKTYQGIDTLHIMPKLPFSVDGTGHIDMWMYIIDDKTVMISEFLPGSNPTAIQVTNNAVPYMQNLGYTVFRVPDHNGYHPNGGNNCHYTYTNAFRCNNRIFIPSYGGSHSQRDADALLAYQTAAGPNVTIVQIPSYDIIWAAGAIHCTVMQVPKYTQSAPAAHVITPAGGDLLVTGDTHELHWAASDDYQVTDVDIYYSTDNGATFPNLVASNLPNNGYFNWLVPNDPTTNAVVKVVANDGSGNSGEGVSETAFEINKIFQRTYDFSTGAGVDKWGWGYQTSGWYNNVDKNRYPVTTDIESIEAGAYAKIAVSDATGPDYDPNRYKGPKPSGGQESTTVFEFTIYEPMDQIKDIEIIWEGYAKDCAQAEVYVWNNKNDNWSDGNSRVGENNYMLNYAANRDDDLEFHIRNNFADYIDNDRKLTLLVYVERQGSKSFTDYVSVKVSHTAGLVADALSVSNSSGGSVNFAVNADLADVGRNYLIFGGVTGTTPGTPLPGGFVTLPINWDIFTNVVIQFVNTSLFQNFAGTISPNGTASATFNSVPSPAAVGLTLYFANAVFYPWDVVSNPVAIQVTP